MANRRFTQFFETLHKKPVLIDCNFIVDPANGNGLGQRSLKGAGIQQVFMNTSATPAPGSPNPAPGVIVVQLQDCYNYYYGGFSGFVSPATGGLLTSGLTVGNPYVIAVVGASTLAQWQAAGVPSGITPAVGVAFIAKATSIAGGGSVVAVGASGIDNIEAIGDPNQTIQSSAGQQAQILGVQSGAYMIFQCLQDGVLTAPATNSVCGMAFYMSNSLIKVNGD